MSSEQARLEVLEKHVAVLNGNVEETYRLIGMLHQNQQRLLTEEENGTESVKQAQMRDTVWACENCAARLGIYDPAADELRVRYKDFVCYIQPGVGGIVRVPCRRCGLANELADTRKVAQVALSCGAKKTAR
jgi:hypothetical protein